MNLIVLVSGTFNWSRRSFAQRQNILAAMKHSHSRFRETKYFLGCFEWKYSHFALVLGEISLQEIWRIKLRVIVI